MENALNILRPVECEGGTGYKNIIENAR
jgi:hypothetical protein